jgi:uncharacterized repeat protein (TIGR01451 family)
MRYFYNQADDLADMQILLHEKSHKIVVQYQNLTGSAVASQTGLEGPAPDHAFVSYQDRCPAMVQNGLAILFEPTVIPHYQHSAELSFAVRTDETLTSDTWITNTAKLSSSMATVERSAGTLVDPVDLGQSSKDADPQSIGYGEALTYTIQIRNSGYADTNAVMRDQLPAELTYQPGSLWCSSGACTYTDGIVSWRGTVKGNSSVPVQFQVTAPNKTYTSAWLTNTATITDIDRNRTYTAASRVPIGDRLQLHLPLIPYTP